MMLFALPEARALGQALSGALNVPLARLEDRAFEDGEVKLRPLVPVRGHDVFVLQALHGHGPLSVHDRLCRLLFFAAALRDHGADRVTMIAPYLCYGRKDRRTKPHDPLTLRYVAQLIEAVGCDRFVTVEAHNVMAFQNAFRCETFHLQLAEVFLDEVARLGAGSALTVMSPDPGGIKRAQLFREAIEAQTGQPVGFAFLDKRRSASVRSTGALSGDVSGARVLIVDDMISTGGTILTAARVARAQGARDCIAMAAHGLFAEDARSLFAARELSQIIVTDSATNPQSSRAGVVSLAPALAACVRQMVSS